MYSKVSIHFQPPRFVGEGAGGEVLTGDRDGWCRIHFNYLQTGCSIIGTRSSSEVEMTHFDSITYCYRKTRDASPPCKPQTSPFLLAQERLDKEGPFIYLSYIPSKHAFKTRLLYAKFCSASHPLRITSHSALRTQRSDS
jgi:hypothetical protein